MSFTATDEFYLDGSIYIDRLADPVPPCLSTLRPFNAAPTLRGPHSAVLGKVTFKVYIEMLWIKDILFISWCASLVWHPW